MFVLRRGSLISAINPFALTRTQAFMSTLTHPAYSTAALKEDKKASEHLQDASDDIEKYRKAEEKRQRDSRKAAGSSLNPTISILGLLALLTGLYFFTKKAQENPDQKQHSQTAAISTLGPSFAVIQQERLRLKEKYDRSYCMYCSYPSIIFSQGYSHWLKLEALHMLEKDLLSSDVQAQRPCFSDRTEKKLKEAYSFYPEEEDKKFKAQYLKEEGKIAGFRRCER